MTHRADSVELFSTVLSLIQEGGRFAVVTVLRADGSTPVPAGAKAVIEADGTIHGTVGGGAAEGKARQLAMAAVRSGEAAVFDFDLGGATAQEAQPICGGAMRLLVDPTAAAGAGDYRRAEAALARRERGIWLTALRQRDRLEVDSRHLSEADLARHDGFPDAEALGTCLSDDTTRLIASPVDAGVEVFIEPLVPKPILVIVGGGHVGQAVAAQASLVGFEIVVLEDRPEFAEGQRFPSGTRTRCGKVAEELAALPISRDTFIAIVTRGHQHDAEALRTCIRRPAAYIGMIGSRRKVPLLRKQFLESGWATAGELDRVYAPIGLDIGAVTVPEIAASIVAQMIAVRRNGVASGISMQ